MDSTMPEFLASLQTRSSIQVDRAEDQLVPVETHQTKNQVFTITSPEDALEALKSNPDFATLTRALRWLRWTAPKVGDFDVKKPGPKAAQVIFTLVSDIIPNYWETLSGEDGEVKNLLIQCLSSVAGVGALTSRLHFLLSLMKDVTKPAQVTSTSKAQALETVIDFFETLLAKRDFVTTIWHGIKGCNLHESQQSLQWKEFVSLVASGKVLSIASEASLTLTDYSPRIKAGSWVGDGNQYASWLGRCVEHTIEAVKDDDVEGHKALSQLLSKALTLGYTGQHNDCYNQSS